MTTKIFRDDKYCENLIIHFAKKYFNKYRNYNITLEDLIQEGFLGLMYAKRNYDNQKNTKFSSYATFWIKKMMLKYINKNKPFETEEIDENQFYYYENYSGTIDENPNDFNKISKLLDADLEQNVFRLFFIEGLPLDEISKVLNIRREKVRQIKEKILRKLKMQKELLKNFL
jgi:RNA polymerase sigma factor (sigma-70 family)